MGLYVPLDVTWPDDESVIEVGFDGAGLHAMILCLAKRGGKDGWVGRRAIARLGATDELLGRLLTCSPEPLLDQRDDGSVRPSGWLKHNPSQAAIEAKKEAKRVAGKLGNHTRWHSGEFATCPLCKDPDPLVVAGSDTGAIAGGSQPESEGIAKGEGEGGSDRTSSHPGFAGPKPAAALTVVRESLGAPASGGERGTA